MIVNGLSKPRARHCVGWTVVAVCLSSLVPSSPAAAQTPTPVRIGVVTDGPSDRDAALEESYRRSIVELLEGEFAVSDVVVDADWTVAGVEAALDGLLADPEVDLILAAGVTASSVAVSRRDLAKPVIAPYVLDGALQGAPIEDGASGVPNLAYVSFPPSFAADLATFRELASFDRVVLLRGPVSDTAARVVDANLNAAAAEVGVRVQLIEAAADARETLARIPGDAQAVYIAPLLAFDEEEVRALARGLIERDLPSFSLLPWDVELGILASNARGEDLERLARRVAILTHRILLGEPAQTLPVTFERRLAITINMATARAIGVYPSFAMEADARLLNPERSEVARVESLLGVVQNAMTANLDLAAFGHAVASARENAREARSALLPQLDLRAAGVVIDEDRAGALQSQRTGSAALAFSQLLYSDRAWANREIQERLAEAREHEREQLRLDVTLASANAYLNVLRAKTVERISRENLSLTRENLERARSRVHVGVANRSEVYRWESQLAADRAAVIQAGAERNVAEIELNRILDRPLEEPFLTREVGLGDATLITSDPRLLPYLRDRAVYRVFRAFNVLEALGNAPELRRIRAGVEAQERAHTATGRAFFLPDVGLQAQVEERFHQGGAGSDASRPFDDRDWQVGVQATLPLFTSGARSAARAREYQELLRLRTELRAAEQRIEQRVRTAMHRAGASHAGIELARESARAARNALDLVSDAYSRGVVSIIDLLDAQSTAFVAELTEANAVYTFLLDLAETERAVGQFDFFGTPQERDAYFERLGAFGTRQQEEIQ
jgi:outer membrane protein TolC